MNCNLVQELFPIDGTTTAFQFTTFEYLFQSDVRVALWNANTKTYDDLTKYTTGLPSGSYWRWQTGQNTIIETVDELGELKALTAQDPGLKIYRETDLDKMQAVFAAGSTIRAQDLNDNYEQLLFLIQEGRCNIPNWFTEVARAVPGKVIVSETAPTVFPASDVSDSRPLESGDMWFNSVKALLYIYYVDNTGPQWISVSITGPEAGNGPDLVELRADCPIQFDAPSKTLSFNLDCLTELATSNTNETVWCIVVLDEDQPNNSFTSNAQSWDQFKATYPDRRHFLLSANELPPTDNSVDSACTRTGQYVNTTVTTVNGIPTAIQVPDNYKADLGYQANFINVARNGTDSGGTNNPNCVDDWFDLCGLDALPSGSTICLLVDNSGSMTTNTVVYAYNLFTQRCAAAGITVLTVNGTTNEYWISPFITDFSI